jgi:phosphoribulokinase
MSYFASDWLVRKSKLQHLRTLFCRFRCKAQDTKILSVAFTQFSQHGKRDTVQYLAAAAEALHRE